MKVNLIDYTGAGYPNPADAAARLLVYVKNTRLQQGEQTRQTIKFMTDADVAEELDAISKTIRSSWEFVDYTWEILGVTRAYTHQQVRSRHASFAQQAQRVVDMSNFDTLCPESVFAAGHGATWTDLMDTISSTYQLLQACGVPNQDARGVLPTNVLTNIIMKTNLREFADICGKRDNLRAQGEYATVVRAMKAEVLKVHPWADIFLSPERTRTPALDEILKTALGTAAPVDQPHINAALKELDTLKGTWG